jgi:uncharacterized membrane protein YadS
MIFVKKNYRGILLAFVIGLIATFLGKSFPLIGGPVFGILLGMVLALFPRNKSFSAGITFTSKKVLQYAIILLGFGMNLFQIVEVGSQSLVIILSTITTALVISYIVSKVLNIPADVSTLVGVGSSICGGSAIAATAPVIDARYCHLYLGDIFVQYYSCFNFSNFGKIARIERYGIWYVGRNRH